MHPGAKAGLLEQHGRNQAHDGAHDADDHQRDGVGDELGPVGGPHKAEGQPGGQLLDHKELQDKGGSPTRVTAFSKFPENFKFGLRAGSRTFSQQ